MVKAIIISLIVGVLYGQIFTGTESIAFFGSVSEIALVVLMFSVGISVGMNKQVFEKMKAYHIKIFIIPIGIIIGSVIGGIVCGMLLGMPLNESVAITSGLGWYSLSGVLLTDLAGAEVGSIAFLANLFREIISFIIIPFIAVHCNHYTAIAPAAATSEDTTLPILMKYTSEEVVMMAVINGVICSAMVPILIQTFYQLL
ncbi:MAG: lysine exporter LysO family protein [Cellulosilyticaceae bacterium]